MAATWAVLRAVEDDAIPGLERRVLAALAALVEPIVLTRVREALAAHDTEAVLAAVPLEQLREALTAILPDLEAVSAAAHDAVAPSLAARLTRGAPAPVEEAVRARLALPFDRLSPNVLEAIRTDGAELVRDVTEETKAAIREIVERAYTTGTHPRRAAKDIERIVGLTRRQAAAVESYRAELTDEGRDSAQVDRMVTRYATKLRKQRAQTIARTEANRAMNAGQRATWSDLEEAGLLESYRWRREWLTVLPAPGVCAICAPMDKATAPLHGTFADGRDGPPAHPNCRCTEVLVPATGA